MLSTSGSTCSRSPRCTDRASSISSGSVSRRARRYPGSVLFSAFSGTATLVQLEAVLASLVKGDFGYETDALLEAIVCNDAAPAAMLEAVLERSVDDVDGWQEEQPVRRHGRRLRNQGDHDAELTRTIMAALVIHPNTPGELRERLKRTCGAVM